MPRRTPGVVTAAMRRAIWDRDHDTCLYCGAVAGALTVDHVVPQMIGGAHTPANLVTACAECNSLRGACPLDLWAVWCARRGLGPAKALLVRVAAAQRRPIPATLHRRKRAR
jgi:hypothetical protein